MQCFRNRYRAFAFLIKALEIILNSAWGCFVRWIGVIHRVRWPWKGGRPVRCVLQGHASGSAGEGVEGQQDC